MKTIKVETYLPLFSGFYNTIWDDDGSQAIDYINSLREEGGLGPINYNDCQFDRKDYEMRVVEGIAEFLERKLKLYVTDITIQKIVSPREYNFRNDSADVIVTLSNDNVKVITAYLQDHSIKFAAYIKERYTSSPGFISSYPANINEFMQDEPLKHFHKLGSILNFICLNEGIEEIDAYYDMSTYLSVSNYNELMEIKPSGF